MNSQEPPPTSRDSAVGHKDRVRVEGKCLVVTTDSVLPPVCIQSNRPLGEGDMARESLYWYPPWVAILALSGPLVIPALFLLRKRCTITYGLVPELRRRYRILRIVRIASIIIAVFVLLFLCAVWIGLPVLYPSVMLDIGLGRIAVANSIAILVVGGLGFIANVIGRPPLRVTNYHRGAFWVTGCSNEYLARIEREEHRGGACLEA